MLIPRAKLYTETQNDEKYCTVKYFVWSEEDCGYIENRFFTHYDTKEECQNAIDYFNSFSIIK